MVNEAKELNDALTKETSERSKGLIKVELDIANRELNDTSKALLKAQSESDITIKKGILQASQKRLRELEIELSRNSMNIAQTEAELAKAKELIRESEEKLLKANKLESMLLSKAVTLSGALAKHETIQSEREKKISQIKALEKEIPQQEMILYTLTQAFQGAQRFNLLSKEATLNGLYHRQDVAEEEREKMISQGRKSEDEITKQQLALDKRKQKYALALANHKDIQQFYNTKYVRAGASFPQLKIISRPTAPTCSSSPRTYRNTLLAGVMGLFGSVFLSFFLPGKSTS